MSLDVPIDPDCVLESTAAMLGIPASHLREALSAALIEQLELAVDAGLLEPEEADELRPRPRDDLVSVLRIPLSEPVPAP